MNYYNGVITGAHCKLRPVTEDDSEFIVALRNEGSRSRFISKSVTSVQAQRDWIRAYDARNRAGLEYYFICCDLQGTSWGTIRVYNINEVGCTGGSWVMSAGAPTAVSIETSLLHLQFVFNILSKNVMYIEVRRANTRVWKWHEMCGAHFRNEDKINRFYDYLKGDLNIAKNLIEKIILKM